MISHDPRKPNAFKLLIRACSESENSWYHKEIGKYFDFFGETPEGYKVKDESGNFAYVKKYDGELVKS